MAKAKAGAYRVLSLLWDNIRNRYIYPGELIDLEAGAAKTLLARGRVALARNEKIEIVITGKED